MKYLFLFLFLVTGGVCLRAQTSADSLQQKVEADPRLRTFVTKHIAINEKTKEKGYRVQIYFGADKAKAKDMKSRFLTMYGTDAHAYEIYEVPNFKIRVGDFRTRLEAYRFLKEIKGEFPTAFIVESDVEIEVK